MKTASIKIENMTFKWERDFYFVRLSITYDSGRHYYLRYKKEAGDTALFGTIYCLNSAYKQGIINKAMIDSAFVLMYTSDFLKP